jgi:hypothetical protein
MDNMRKRELKPLLEIIRYGCDWAYDPSATWPDSEDETIYNCGARETLGHIVACWLVQHNYIDSLETAVGTDLIFGPSGKPLSERLIINNIQEACKPYKPKKK